MKRISVMARKEVIQKHRAAYRKAGKKEKGALLDALAATTGLSREHVGRMLRRAPPGKKKVERRGRKPVFHERVVVECLEVLWKRMDCICGKRLCAGMPMMVEALRRHSELQFPDWAVDKVLAMSPATADRLLRKTRQAMTVRGHSTTKPGTLLKKSIPIRMGTEWDENMPGFVEIDLVAHCGETTKGEYVNTLDITDVNSGWTEVIAVKNKARIHVLDALKTVRARLPFTLLGVDSDNGGEFINEHMMAYCQTEKLTFTRGRPYQKNDGCHVEQKNYSLVRRHIGYGRYQGQTATDALNAYYDLLRLYQNFFLPSMKLQEKTRHEARVTKRYDMPQTPYQRLIASPHLTPKQKASLQIQFDRLNPAALQRAMAAVSERLLMLALPNARPLADQ